ncbi:AAA family ATPase [Butyrivibrio sp. CB08]|uniref:AAA family ATPase n=1 Tax=Butyrivibrio sp. CB08 TaxID=2364879 RepID=UPI0011C23096|nr:AAA family ATPase [Butyrivibrio sp. CB08]
MDSVLAQVKLENSMQKHPLNENQLRYVITRALDDGAQAPPIVCNSVKDIDLEDVNEPFFFIPQILSNGHYMLNSPPKEGKSRLLMQMALALCKGGLFMGKRCVKTSVLYLALEDERLDFESRLKLFLNYDEPPENLYFATLEDFDYSPPTLEGGELTELIEENLSKHPDIQIILIDVFGVIRSKRRKGEDFTDTERRDVLTLNRLAAQYKIALVVAHHVSHTKRKGTIETIGSGAGSYVISATVHGEMLLYKNQETGAHTFSVQGRRLALQKFAIEDDFPRWRYCGTNDEYEAANNPLVITVKHLIDNAEGGKWSGTGKELLDYNTSNKLPQIIGKINRNTFSVSIIRLLSISGIRYKQIKNGNGTIHKFEKL